MHASVWFCVLLLGGVVRKLYVTQSKGSFIRGTHPTNPPDPSNHACTNTNLQIRWPGSVIVFDEAHNIEGVASDAWSVEISTGLTAGVQEEMERAHDKWKTQGRSGRFVLLLQLACTLVCSS